MINGIGMRRLQKDGIAGLILFDDGHKKGKRNVEIRRTFRIAWLESLW